MLQTRYFNFNDHKLIITKIIKMSYENDDHNQHVK